MNYFGHGYIAARHRPEPGFVFGAMLPDLVQLVGGKAFETLSRAIEEGAAFHLRTDAQFHAHPAFTEAQAVVLHDLRAVGVTRGPARAAAHIGVEMLIDGCLAEDQAIYFEYERALLHGAEAYADVARFGELAGLLRHLHSRGKAAQSVAADRLIFRLGRALGGRPRLRATDAELSLIAERLVQERQRVDDSVPSLVVDLLKELSSADAPIS